MPFQVPTVALPQNRAQRTASMRNPVHAWTTDNPHSAAPAKITEAITGLRFRFWTRQNSPSISATNSRSFRGRFPQLLNLKVFLAQNTRKSPLISQVRPASGPVFGCPVMLERGHAIPICRGTCLAPISGRCPPCLRRLCRPPCRGRTRQQGVRRKRAVLFALARPAASLELELAVFLSSVSALQALAASISRHLG
jgi:hypothetical protein